MSRFIVVLPMYVYNWDLNNYSLIIRTILIWTLLIGLTLDLLIWLKAWVFITLSKSM